MVEQPRGPWRRGFFSANSRLHSGESAIRRRVEKLGSATNWTLYGLEARATTRPTAVPTLYIQSPDRPACHTAAVAWMGQRRYLREEWYAGPTRSATTAARPAEVPQHRLSRETHPPGRPRTENSWSRPAPAPRQAVAGGSRRAPRDRPRGLAPPPGHLVPSPGSNLDTGRSADTSRPLRILGGPAPR